MDFDVYIETHRDRMTTDLLFTLGLLDRFPDLPLLADLSHFLVGREFPYPVSADNHSASSTEYSTAPGPSTDASLRANRCRSRFRFLITASGWSFASTRWKYGFLSWAKRSGPNASLTFACELGPKPYAITDRDGNDTTDRWAEALN